MKDSRGRSPFWTCCYSAADGRRLKKSTKQTDRKKALEVCLALERAEGMARSGTLTEARARLLVGEVLQRTSGETLEFFTTEQWFRHWVEAKAESKSSGTAVRYKQITEEFLEALGRRAKLNVAAITTKDVLTFRRARSAKGLAPSTVNLDVKIIGGAFNAASHQGFIPTNPCSAIEALPDPAKVESGEKATFSPQHVRALMEASVVQHEDGSPVFEAGEDWRGLILYAYYIGARLQDGANVRWEAIDLSTNLVTYTARKSARSKKSKRIVVPIHPELEAYLLSQPAPDSAKAFVFPKLAGLGTAGRTGLSRTFARIMARAKITGGVARERNKKGRTVHTLTFHSLRHSFNSAMANAGVSEELRMKLTGHVTRDTHAGYTHHELESLRGAISKLPRVAEKAA